MNHAATTAPTNIGGVTMHSATSVVVIIIQLLFQNLGPMIGSLLDADFSKPCFAGIHAEWVHVAWVSVVVYLIGLPAGTVSNSQKRHNLKVHQDARALGEGCKIGWPRHLIGDG